MSPEQLRAELVAVLGAADRPTTTSAARIAVTRNRGRRARPVVAEEVGRALRTLQRRGVVRRVHDQPARLAHWELMDSHRPHDERASRR